MALKTFVKLNSITNLTDARYGAGMYVNLLGFDLDSSSPNYISPEQFNEITGWVSGVDLVGEFTEESKPDLAETLKSYPSITWVECDNLWELDSLIESSYSLIYRLPLGEIGYLKKETIQFITDSEIYLHLVSDETSLTAGQLEEIKILSATCKVLLGVGITEENILDLLNETGIYGISLTGGEEIKPGLKDMNELADILEKLESED